MTPGVLWFHASRLFCDLFACAYVRAQKGGFWAYRERLRASRQPQDMPPMYAAYLESKCAYVGLGTEIEAPPVLPHGLHGIHISNGARIGSGCTIMQNVTIGSNTLSGTGRKGSPRIGRNVFIGAGATIVGAVEIGDNVRIGAGTCVFRNVPDNQTVTGGGDMRLIPHAAARDNSFVSINEIGR